MRQSKKIKKQTYASIRKRPLGKYLLGTGGIIETKLWRDFVFDQFIRNKSWSGIENFAKQNGIYTPDELRKIIKDHSPIKSFGDANMELARIIYEVKIKNPKKSFWAICVDNMDKLCVLVKQDPYKVSKGENWFKLQKEKNNQLKRSHFSKHYTDMIKIFDNRYKRVMEKQKVFLTWYAQNKDSKDFLHFLYKTLKYLKSQNKILK